MNPTHVQNQPITHTDTRWKKIANRTTLHSICIRYAHPSKRQSTLIEKHSHVEPLGYWAHTVNGVGGWPGPGQGRTLLLLPVRARTRKQKEQMKFGQKLRKVNAKKNYIKTLIYFAQSMCFCARILLSGRVREGLCTKIAPSDPARLHFAARSSLSNAFVSIVFVN